MKNKLCKLGIHLIYTDPKRPFIEICAKCEKANYRTIKIG